MLTEQEKANIVHENKHITIGFSELNNQGILELSDSLLENKNSILELKFFECTFDKAGLDCFIEGAGKKIKSLILINNRLRDNDISNFPKLQNLETLIIIDSKLNPNYVKKLAEEMPNLANFKINSQVIEFLPQFKLKRNFSDLDKAFDLENYWQEQEVISDTISMTSEDSNKDVKITRRNSI